MQALFDVVIPTHNNFKELLNCLKSLENQTVKDFKAWICVDGSTDETVDFLKQKNLYPFAYAVLQHSDKKNHGRAATRNLALPYLQARYVVFLDSDLYVQNDFLEKHFSLVKKENTISIGQVKYEKPRTVWVTYLLSRGENRHYRTEKIAYKYFVSGNVAIPVNQARACDGFDENFTVYGGEDTEFGYRLEQKFHPKFFVNADATAFGKSNKSLEEGLRQRQIFAATGLKYIRTKHPEFDTVFHVKFMDTKRAECLYRLLPERFIKQLVSFSFVPDFLKIKLIHLLVFAAQYKGYHSS